jgi:hypothetical protein
MLTFQPFVQPFCKVTETRGGVSQCPILFPQRFKFILALG